MPKERRNPFLLRHPRESGDPSFSLRRWIDMGPAFAGVTVGAAMMARGGTGIEAVRP
jgi:hypothetical protein